MERMSPSSISLCSFMLFFSVMSTSIKSMPPIKPKTKPTTEESASRQGLFFEKTLEKLIAQLRGALEVSPFDGELVRSSLEVLQDAFQSASEEDQQKSELIIEEAVFLFSRAENEIKAAEKRLASEEEQKGIERAIEQELKKKGVWGGKRYSKLQENIARLVDQKKKKSFFQQLEGLRQQAQTVKPAVAKKVPVSVPKSVGKKPMPAAKEDFSRQGLFFEETLKNLIAQLRGALEVSPFDSELVRSSLEVLQDALQSTLEEDHQEFQALIEEAAFLFSRAEDEIKAVEKKLASEEKQEGLVQAIEQELKKKGVWGEERYSKLQGQIAQLVDENKSKRFFQQLEEVWQQVQASSIISTVIKSMQVWNKEIYDEIKKNINEEKSFDQKMRSQLLNLLESEYEGSSKKPVSVRQKISPELCEQIRAIDSFTSPDAIDTIMRKLRAVQIEQPEVKKMDVSSQFVEKGGGGASCGYHALKNGIYIARAIRGLSEWRELKSFDVIKDLFGTPESRWRKLIIFQRTGDALNDYINQQLTTTYLPFQVATSSSTPWVKAKKISDVYLSALRSYAREIARTINENGGQLTVNRETVVRAMSKKLPSQDSIKADLDSYVSFRPKDMSEQEVSGAIFEHLRNHQTMEHYLKLEAQSVTFSRATIQPAFKKAQEKDYLKLPDGDWIYDLDIQQLYDLEREAGGLLCPAAFGDVQVGLTVVNNIKQIEEDPAVFPALIEAAKAYAHHNQYLHIFCLNMPGHWVTLVLHRDGNKVRYFTANSSGGDVIESARPFIHVLEALKYCYDNNKN